MSYDPRVVAAIRRIAQKRGVPSRYLTGAYATGIVESGLRDLPGGDADSYGFRQQRQSIYGRQPLNRQINNLFNEFKQYDRGQPLGELIADVQRPAAQYRGRYAQVLDQARKLAGGAGGDEALPTGGGPAASSPAAPQAAGQNPFSVISGLSTGQQGPYAETLQRGWDLLGKIWEQKYGQSGPTLAGVSVPEDEGVGGRGTDNYTRRANLIDQARLPYKWGGGHQGRVNVKDPVPLDCSGAVSAVLGIDPRVSGQFESWGKPGEGGHKGVTVYANAEHVLMKINGHFFGTSATNPGGGAGWIPQKAISREYLKRFTARHL